MWRNVEATMRELMAITKAMADETRVRILMALRQQELCVCQITELVGLAPSTISKHMSILSQAKLVFSRKEGRWIFYRPAGTTEPEAVSTALIWLANTLEKDNRILDDTKRLQEILKIDKEELCRLKNLG